MENWQLLKVVADGEPLLINGINVWDYEWNDLGADTFEVPHPSYPKQRHKLWPYYVEAESKRIVFAAGELSNCVWCFYVTASKT
ncbi:hypothetical protein ACQUQU_05060 [Thalassolituus sp. LLYu03]|uniref:hypothetical protein n=1 Tax=Thalassolituus sp. LLYu03 TaxID=3421656 RepID=UPI003D2DC2D7